jgi:ATP-dependent RNA helicase TDRD9
LFFVSCSGELGYATGTVMSDHIPILQAGALLPNSHGLPNVCDGDITFMGYVMAKLPVDICIAKLILLGNTFSVLEECIIMGK